MSRRRKIFLWIIGSLICLTSLLVGFLLLLPYLITLEPTKEKILALLSAQVGGKVEYRKLDLFYFPQPGVKVSQVRISIPDKVEGTFKSIQVYPGLFAILRGKLRIKTIQAESPDFNIQLPKAREKIKKQSKPPILEEIEETIGHVASIFPSLHAILKDGKLNFLEESTPILSLSHLDGHIVFPPGGTIINLVCRSNLWEKMSLEATLNPVERKGSGHMEVVNFFPHKLPDSLLASLPFRVEDGRLNLKTNFKTERQGVLQAQVEGSIPMISYHQGGKAGVIQASAFNGTFKMEEKRIQVVLTELKLDSPELKLSGRFEIDQKVPLFVLEVQGRDVDVASTREAALKLANKIPVMNTIFDIVRDGRIPLITFQSHGRRMSDLDDTERFTIQGKILDGKISIPVGEPEGDREDFTLMKAAGEVVISRGILEGRNLRAQWKNQQLQDGKLRVGLEGEDAPLHVEIAVDTDLSLLPPFLKRVIKDQTFLEEMVRFRQMEGRAKGRLVLSESLKSIGVKVDAQEVNLVARHDQIPYPVTIHGGAVSFEGERLIVRNLSGKVGTSSFSGLTGRIGLGRELSIEISSGNSVISLEEIYPWLSADESVRGGLKNIHSVKGEVTLSGMKLSGPLTKPGKWDFETTGELEDLIVSTSLLPEPFAVSSGKFNLSPQKIMIADFQTKFLSASLNASGALYDYQRGLERAELSLSGRVTPKDVQWLSNTLGLESKVELRSPVGISRLDLSYRKGSDIGLRGDFAVQNGPEISLDLLRHSNGIKINNLVIRDDISDASIKLDVKGRAIDISFSGRLSEKTIGTILTQFQSRNGWVRGDFQAQLDMDQPVVLVAHGKVELNHFSLPSEFGRFPEIDEASVNARGDRVTVERSNFMWGGKRLALSGDVSFIEKRIALNLDLTTENIDVKSDLDMVRDIFSREKKGGKDEGIQLQGTLRIKTKSLLYDRIAWMPFDAEVMFDPQGVEVVVRETNLCGISTPGNVKIGNQSLSLDFRPFSKSQELQSAFRCLLDEEMRVRGDFDLQGRIVAQGKPEDLIGNLKGNVEFQAKDGHVSYSKGLMRVLEFVNSTEIYRGKLPDPGKEGVDYKLIKIRAAFKGGKLIIEEVTIDGRTLELVAKGEIDLMKQELNLIGLVAPLKTVDRIVKLTPVVREIFAGTLIIIPFRVHGSLKDPKVTALSASAIGDEILAMMKRTLGLPFKVIEPFVPTKKEKSGEGRF